MKQILLVENRVAFREALALLIARRLEHENIQAGSPNEARGLVAEAEDAVGLAIVDLDSPAGDAVELIRELRDAFEGISVFAFTNGRDPQTRTRAFGAGADEVLALRVSGRRFLNTIVRLGEVTQQEERQQA